MGKGGSSKNLLVA